MPSWPVCARAARASNMETPETPETPESTETTIRKTFKYKLKPTPAQERQLEEIVWQCRRLYNTALERRITLWKQRGVSRSQHAQEAELKDLRAALSDYAA